MLQLKKGSLVALQDKGKILMKIRSDPIMKQRWDHHCKENYYVNGIEFDEVIEVLVGIVNSRQDCVENAIL